MRAYILDNSFLAFGRDIIAFNSTVQWNNRPCFRYGMTGLGSINGVWGRAGLAEGPQLTGPFVGFAGVFGESHDDPGTAGTSVNHIGVYGQTEELDKGTPVLVAGVYGTGNTRPGVIGFSKAGPGVMGSSDQAPGVFGTSNAAAAVFGFSSESIGVMGQTNNADSFAGFFEGQCACQRRIDGQCEERRGTIS